MSGDGQVLDSATEVAIAVFGDASQVLMRLAMVDQAALNGGLVMTVLNGSLIAAGAVKSVSFVEGGVVFRTEDASAKADALKATALAQSLPPDEARKEVEAIAASIAKLEKPEPGEKISTLVDALVLRCIAAERASAAGAKLLSGAEQALNNFRKEQSGMKDMWKEAIDDAARYRAKYGPL